jgi:hypothetical protein
MRVTSLKLYWGHVKEFHIGSDHFSFSLFRFPSILLPPFPLQSSGVLYTWMMIVTAPLLATKTSGWGTYSEEVGGKYNVGRNEEQSSVVIPTTHTSPFRCLSIVETAFYFPHSSYIVSGNIIYLLLLLLLLFKILNSPSSWNASAANAIDSDYDIFNGSSVPVNHII